MEYPGGSTSIPVSSSVTCLICHLSCGVGGVPNVIQNTKPLVDCEVIHVILKHIIVQGKNSILVPTPQTLFSGTCHILLQGMVICVTASMHPENITFCKIAQ